MNIRPWLASIDNLRASAFAAGVLLIAGCSTSQISMAPNSQSYSLTFQSPTDPGLQAQLESIDAQLRERFGLNSGQTSVALLDLRTLRLALIHADHIEYAASVAKIGILLAYFQLHPEAATNLADNTRHELGLMVKASSNEMATRYSRELGLHRIQEVLDSYGFYDRAHGGGIWLGKHYGQSDERIPDPVGGFAHAATARQVLRFFLLLEQGRLVSPQASSVMRRIFESPEIPHDQHKFVRGLANRRVEIIRKWGSWEEWLHDAAVIKDGKRHYILVALTRHRNGDAYLEALAPAVDDLLRQ